MKLNLKEIVTNNSRNWNDFNHPVSLKTKHKIARSLIKDKNIKVSNKIVTNPDMLFHPNVRVQKFKYNTKLNYYWDNLYMWNTSEFERPLVENNDSILYSPRRTSTYKYNMFLNKTSIKKAHTLDYIVFYGGWVKSIKESQHIIKQGVILCDGKVIKNNTFRPKKGSVITNLKPNSIFKYYIQRYHATYINIDRTMKNTYKKGSNNYLSYLEYERYPFATPCSTIIKLNFNKVAIL
jgi:ribosomal protein S4